MLTGTETESDPLQTVGARTIAWRYVASVCGTRGGVVSEKLKHGIRVALIIAAVLATALAWSGLSLRDILTALR